MKDYKKLFVELISKEFWESGKKFILDDQNKKQISLCFDWVIGKESDSFRVKDNKGLLLMGRVGTGKSCILKATMKFAEYLHEISTVWVTSDSASEIFKGSNIDDTNYNRLCTCKILSIDDIGKEPALVFGSSPIGAILRERYDKKRITCFTTNLKMKDLLLRYDESFEDKLYQMCLIIPFEGESKR